MTEVSRPQFALLLLAVVAVILIGGRALKADAGSTAAPALPAAAYASPSGSRAVEDSAESSSELGSSGPTGVAGAPALEAALVHVAGAVRRPGVYELRAGARVRDAVARAGGGRAGANLDALNLAAKVTDGQQVLVARRDRPNAAASPGTARGGAAAGPRPADVSTAAAGAGAGGPVGGPVNVNQADAPQLEALNGVGPAIAAKIVDWRTQNGPFRSLEDLAQVPGIGPKKLEGLRAQAVP